MVTTIIQWVLKYQTSVFLSSDEKGFTTFMCNILHWLYFIIMLPVHMLVISYTPVAPFSNMD